jgi:TonB family protein
VKNPLRPFLYGATALFNYSIKMKAFRAHLLFVLLASGAPVWAQKPAAAPTASVNSVRKMAPVYPYEYLLQNKTGSAEVQFTVEYSGRAIMVRKVDASDDLFAKALMADVESNEFIPPRVNGEPRLTTGKLRFAFNGDPGLDAIQKSILTELRKPKPAIVSVKELDKAPFPVRQDPPNFPYALQSDAVSGKAEVEFVIDRDGRVVFPRIVSASHEDFGWAAATAVSRWRYSAPVKGGQKVDARMTLVINFDAATLATTW